MANRRHRRLPTIEAVSLLWAPFESLRLAGRMTGGSRKFTSRLDAHVLLIKVTAGLCRPYLT